MGDAASIQIPNRLAAHQMMALCNADKISLSLNWRKKLDTVRFLIEFANPQSDDQRSVLLNKGTTSGRLKRENQGFVILDRNSGHFGRKF